MMNSRMSVNNKTAYISAVTDIAIQNRNFEFTMNGFHSNKLLMRAVAINTLLMQLLLPISIAFTPLISLSVRADELDEIMTKMRSAEILVESTTAPAPIYSEQPKTPSENSAVSGKFQPSNPFIAQEDPSLLPPSQTLPDLGSENQTSEISAANVGW